YRLCQPIRTALARISGTRLGMICVSSSLMSRAGAVSIALTSCLRQRPQPTRGPDRPNTYSAAKHPERNGPATDPNESRGEIAKSGAVAPDPFRLGVPPSRLDDN